MKIRYKKGHSKFYLIMTIIWTIILNINILYGDSENWTFWIWIVLPIGYISNYTFKYIKQYLTIEDGIIYRNSPFPKKVELNKITIFKKFAGDYIIETDQTKLIIDTTLIEQYSLIVLNQTLMNYTKHIILENDTIC